MTCYNTGYVKHPLNVHVSEQNDRDRPPSLAGRVIPKPIGNTFWGRITSYDHGAVRRMLRKEPGLINCMWEDLTPITCLLNVMLSGRRRIRDDLDESYYSKHVSRMLKMLRILCDAGAVIDSASILPYFERYPFHDEYSGRRVFNMLLHRGLDVSGYSLLNESEIMLLESSKHTRNEKYVFWGRKIVADYLRNTSRMLVHVYYRDMCDIKPDLCLDVIGEITSYI